VIATLRKDFVNTWLLAKDLDGIAARSKDADITRVCKLIKDNYGYPVDSVLLSSDLRVVGHLNVHEPRATDPGGYLAFLYQGRAAARGEATAGATVAAETRPAPAATRPQGPRPLKLTPAAPTASVLEVIRRRAFGKSSMSFFMIDATAFADGGTIEITVRVGDAEAAGKFELCGAVQGGMAPVRTLQKVIRGETASMTYEFTQGARFGLAAMPVAATAEGDCNAFLATVTVRGR